MDMSETLTVEYRQDGVATLTLNRLRAHNALDRDLVALLIESLDKLGADATIRVVVLAALGASFCAGADLAAMRDAGRETRFLSESKALATLMGRLAGLPKPTVAMVQGPAFGGGVGLVAACDIAIAVSTATFSLTEVRLGLIPAVIAPYLIRAMGARQTRRFALTAQKISADEAKRLGLVHDVVPSTKLVETCERVSASLARGGPEAVARIKDLLTWLEGGAANTDVAEETARRFSEARASDEGHEGVAAFLEKRQPRWRIKDS